MVASGDNDTERPKVVVSGAPHGFSVEESPARVRLFGDWTLETADSIWSQVRQSQSWGRRSIDASALQRIDLAGAQLIRRAARCGLGEDIDVQGASEASARLLRVARDFERLPPAPKPAAPAGRAALEGLGRNAYELFDGAKRTLAFLGQTLVILGRLARNPKKIRWLSIVAVMESAGLAAMPIIALLSFFVGIVVAYLGARTLSDFGVQVFTVELVGVSVFREFAVVITAVLLAGRTDSAFTAEIGAMKMRQEIDAMRVMGIDPMEALVAPRVVAMLIMMPILTFAAMIAGLAGGLIACWGYLDVSPAMFFARIQDGVPAQHFWVGMSKAPVFALVLAVVACRHGLEVGGDVGSLGKRVTAAVVEAIFVVVALDALFALWFLELDL